MLKAFDGGAVFGSVHGAARPRVLALHGWGRTSADFDAVLEGFDAIAVDLAGFGATPPPSQGWGAAEYATSVAVVLADMATPVVVLGHSFGGRVALHLAASRPAEVAALVLTGVPLLRPAGTGAGSRGRQPAPAYRVGRALHRRGMLSDVQMEALRQRYGSADYRAASGVMRAVHVRAVNESYERELAAVTCPVDLVWGDDDAEVPLAVAEAARASLADAHLVIVAGAGHLTPLTAPEALRQSIERRLAALR